MTSSRLSRILLPLLGLGLVLLLWTALSQTVATDLPSPARTWEESRRYVLEPFFKDGEMNQGILRLAFYSLVRVAKGYLLALAIGTPIGFLLGLSRPFRETFDPLIQFLRPISPLAWLPLGLVIFRQSEPAAVFTIALCAMWPTVINTAVGVQSISQDYLNVGRVLRLSRWKMLIKIIVPASLPYVFTGFRIAMPYSIGAAVVAELISANRGLGYLVQLRSMNFDTTGVFVALAAVCGVVFVANWSVNVVERRLLRWRPPVDVAAQRE